MAIRPNGPGAGIPEPFKNTLSSERANLSTLAYQIKSCGHGRAVVRNVVAPGDAAKYICRDCFAHLRCVEVRVIEVDRVRSQLDNLFRKPYPQVACGPGGLRPIWTPLATAPAERRAGR